MDNIHMKTIKFLKDDGISLNGTKYRPYTIGELPNRFGCIQYGEGDGINEWFGYKGFCYVIDNR